MNIQIGFGLWRYVRIVLLWLSLTLLFIGAWFLMELFFPASTTFATFGLFSLFLLIGLLTVGSPDEALAAWHEEQLRTTRDLYSALYYQSPVPYLTISDRGVISTGNQAAARLLGRSIEELIDSTLVDRLNHEDDVKMSVILGKFNADATFLGEELQLSTYSGEVRWVAMSLFVNTTFKQKLVTLVDITQHKVVDKAKSEFVALATHQLRTPVAAIRWNVELLERSLRAVTTDKQTTYLVKIARNVSRMLALINDFLSVSKLETGTFATTPEPIELSTYLPTIVEEFEGQIKEKNITLITNYTPAPLTFVADTRLFHIITSNLLSNAVKYVRPNDSINFGYMTEGAELVFTVKDTGIGIPADQLPRLFSKFFRATNASKHRAEGTGLGLYIVQESVTQLGGTITVQSVENEGTTFIVRLPLS
jgi:PAS domain S-box-containing protein